MQKHLLRYPWIFAAIIAGILACTVLLHMLFEYDPAPASLPAGVKFVKEAMRHAAL